MATAEWDPATAKISRLKPVIASPDDLTRRVLLTLALLGVSRVGGVIPTPGVNTDALAILAEQTAGPLFGLYNMFSGGNLAQVTILALGLAPYISASALVQLLAVVWPRLKRLSQEGDLGRRTIRQYTRYGTLALCAVSALAIARWLESQTNIAGGLPLVLEPGWSFRVMTVLTLTTGTVFLMWLGEQITARGVGNGMALIIFAGIVVNGPIAVLTTIDQVRVGQMGLVPILVLTIVMVCVTGAVVFIMAGHRRVSVQYPKKVVAGRHHSRIGPYLPLRVSTSGLIPVGFAATILAMPWNIAAIFPVGGWGSAVTDQLANGMPLYYLLYVGGIVFFAYLYTAIIFDPDDLAAHMQKYGGVIPGVRPGKDTAEHIDTILNRTTLVWACSLALVAILPDLMIVGFRADTLPVIGDWLAANILPELAFITDGLGVTFYFGGTSLLLIVAVSLDTVQQVQSQLSIRCARPDAAGRNAGESTAVETGVLIALFLRPVWPAAVKYETFVPVLTLRGAAQVPLVESVLRSRDIRFWIKNAGVQDFIGAGRIGTGYCAATGTPVVCVDPRRAEEATALLARVEAEQRIGTVVHYFATPQVGVVQLVADVEVGETLRFRARGADFQQVAQSMQIDHRPVQTASAATAVAVKVDQRVRAGTRVYRVTPGERHPLHTVPRASLSAAGVQ